MLKIPVKRIFTLVHWNSVKPCRTYFLKTMGLTQFLSAHKSDNRRLSFLFYFDNLVSLFALLILLPAEFCIFAWMGWIGTGSSEYMLQRIWPEGKANELVYPTVYFGCQQVSLLAERFFSYSKLQILHCRIIVIHSWIC